MNVQININLKHLLVLMLFIGILAAAQAATSVLRDGTTQLDGLNITRLNISDVCNGCGKDKLVTTTRDVSVTGAQAITGAGFKPSSATIYAVIGGGTNRASWGYTDGTLSYVQYSNAGGTGGNFNIDTSNLILLQEAAETFAQATITSMDSDGATITWSKSGTPTGTAYLLIKFER